MPSQPPATPPASSNPTHTNRLAFALVTSLFFMWGFLTVMNDILVPHFKTIFELNYAQAMFVQFTFFLAYFLLSLPSGRIVGRIGYQRSMVLGLVTMAAGSWLFIAAAAGPYYGLFLTALFVLASGMTLLQVSSNPYVTALGPPRTASSRLNLAQAINSLGTAIAPWLGGALILGTGTLTVQQIGKLPAAEQQAYRVVAAASVKMPYLIFGAILLVLAITVWRFHLPVLSAIEGGPKQKAGAHAGPSVWHVRHLMLGAAGIFLYCGAEVSIGSFLVNFMADPKIAGFPAATAAHYVSLYWTGAMVGRFLGAALLQRVKASNLLGTYGACASLLVWICVLSTGHTAMWTIISVGLLNSIMFPSIFALAIEDLGPLTGDGSGVLIMAILGAAVIPLAQGFVADRIGVHHAYFLPALCYLYVVYYGFRGYRHAPVIAT